MAEAPAVAEAPAEEKLEKPWRPSAPPASTAILGRLDNPPFDCDGVYGWRTGRGRCGGTTFDIIDEGKFDARVQCVFCLATQVVSLDGLGIKRPHSFVFTEGIFSGKPIDEVATLEDGMTYIEFMARKARSEEVRKKCREWIDANKGAA
jgi:hypothetical protein